MKILASYLGLPALVLGLACSTTGTHTRTARAGESPAVPGAQAEPGSAGTGTAPGELKGHASDQVITGRIADASDKQVVIDSSDGRQQTLSVADQTVVTLGGQESSASSLQPGQDVRASFNEQDGRNVAVKIDAQPIPGTGVTTPGSPPGTAPSENSSRGAGMGATPPAPPAPSGTSNQ